GTPGRLARGCGAVRTIPPPVEWCGDSVRILDQRALPHRKEFLECRTVEEVAGAIRSMAIRGAPVLGIAAAFGVALAAATSRARGTNALVATRPTAVNIRWAVARVLEVARDECCRVGATRARVHEALVAEALRIEAEDREACAAMGRHGVELVPERANVLTHCNTGRLCTAGIGTALGVVYT